MTLRFKNDAEAQAWIKDNYDYYYRQMQRVKACYGVAFTKQDFLRGNKPPRIVGMDYRHRPVIYCELQDVNAIRERNEERALGFRYTTIISNGVARTYKQEKA